MSRCIVEFSSYDARALDEKERGMEPRAKQRVRLWLRSERARGLDAVPASNIPEEIAVSPEPAASESRERRSSEAPNFSVKLGHRLVNDATTPIAKPTANGLFGKDAAAASASAPKPLMPLPVAAPITAPVLSTQAKRAALLAMDDKEVRGCTRCRLCETRTQTVFGEGNPDAPVFFIGEGPGQNEDETGRPFVGRAGELLNKMIVGMGLSREGVFIANVVKCRPPDNRTPAPDEVATCTPYLERQLEIVRPSVIVTLGLPATQYMLQQKVTMGRVRGQWQSWRGIKLMPTYHPAYILRSYTEENRKMVWDDLKKVMAELGLPTPNRKSGG